MTELQILDFGGYSLRTRIGNDKERVYPQEIKEDLGIDVYGNWIIPDHYYIGPRDSNWDKMYNELTSLNLKLTLLPLINEHSKYDIVLGAVSGFNFDDILFYLSCKYSERPKELSDRQNRIQK